MVILVRLEFKNTVLLVKDVERSKKFYVELLGQEKVEHVGAGNYETTCPFHDDKFRSMIYNDRFQKYHCFECNANGDAISFLMVYKCISFEEACKWLAKKFNVKLEKATKENASKEKLKEVITHLLNQLVEEL